MRFYRFRVKVPNLGWIPVSAWARDWATAQQEVEARYEDREDIEQVRQVCLYRPLRGDGKEQEKVAV
jgi:hypothetical protein